MRHGLSPARLVGSAWSAVALAMALVACQTSRRAVRPPLAAPSADFLLAAGDSTFWVTTGSQGIRVRGSPLLLAHFDGRFYELYVADEDHSFYDAVFTTQRIYRRDLLTGDSVAVFRDTAVARAAHGYAAAHPDDTPLAPDEDAAEDPSTSVTGEVDIVDVDGPFVSYEYHGSSSAREPADGDHGRPPVESPERETVRRGVVDLRAARRASLRGIFGAAAAESVVGRGRRAFAAAIDSVRAAQAAGDERAGRATAALDQLAFDPLSFSITDVGREPAVQFFAVGSGSRSGVTLPVAPIRVSNAANTPWWDEERGALPTGGPDSASDVWTRSDFDVVARYDTIGSPEQGQGAVLMIRGMPGGRRPAQDTIGHEWRIGRFPAPTRRIYWLDAPPIDTAMRRALVRAFDESALYGDDARSVRWSLPPTERRHRPRAAFAAVRRHLGSHRPRRHGAHATSNSRAVRRWHRPDGVG